jgi:Raf kinase inhibitor-like YbhB/YbcL family protein
MEDPDASSGTFTHWILFNVPNEQLVLAEAVDPASIGARVGMNDFHNLRYNGPCPPPHEQHRYVFRVFALDAPLNAPDGADRDTVFAAMANHVTAEGYLVGTFSH